MKNIDEYVEHSAGFYNFLAWMEEKKDTGFNYEISNDVIYLDSLLSRYFSIGIAKTKKYNNKIFIAIPPDEAEWFHLVKWDKVILKKGNDYIYFLSKSINGDNMELPDIPSFCIALYVDIKDKKNILSKQKKILGIEYFLDDTNVLNFNFHKKIFDIPVETYDENKDIVKIDNLFDYNKYLSMNGKYLEEKFATKPDFIGDVQPIEGSEGLFKRWMKNKI